MVLMTRTQAAREARKRWGVKAIIRAYEALSSPEKRAAALHRLQENRARREAIDREVSERLKALDWYQQLQAERRECNKAVSEAQGRCHYYKFSVGKEEHGFAFMVEGQGDTWEEAFGKAQSNNDKRTERENKQ